MFRFLAGFIILNLLLSAVYSQTAHNQYSYIDTGTEIIAGVDIIDGGSIKNAKICKIVLPNKDTVAYLPEDIERYVLKDGRVYVSEEIFVNGNPKYVFLELMEKGKVELYYYISWYGKRFFLKKEGGEFIELSYTVNSEINYRDFLKEYLADNEEVSALTIAVNFNKYSLSSLIRKYNKDSYVSVSIVRYGVSPSFVSSKFNVPVHARNTYVDRAMADNKTSFSIGAFIDYPIRGANYSLYSELNLINYKINYEESNVASTTLKNKTLILAKIPLLFRQYFQSRDFGYNVNYFFNVGASTTYTVVNEVYDVIVMPHILIGYVFGAGVKFRINELNSLFAEMRFDSQNGIYHKIYGYKYPLFTNSYSNMNNYSVIIGVSF